MLWACLSLPFHLAFSSLQVFAQWFGSQVYTTCFQLVVAMFYRSLNLNMTFPYLLDSCSVSSSVLPGPFDLLYMVSLLPFQSYFTLQNFVSCFRLSGGLTSLFRRGFTLLCPVPKRSRSKRRRRWYHRHYHRRVKFLHRSRPPCPKLPNIKATLPQRFCRHVTTLTSMCLSSVANLITPSSCIMAISSLPAYIAVSSLLSSSNFFISVVSWYAIA